MQLTRDFPQARPALRCLAGLGVGKPSAVLGNAKVKGICTYKGRGRKGRLMVGDLCQSIDPAKPVSAQHSQGHTRSAIEVETDSLSTASSNVLR